MNPVKKEQLRMAAAIAVFGICVVAALIVDTLLSIHGR